MILQICSDKVCVFYVIALLAHLIELYLQNKPNGQFQLAADAKTILAFMHDLSIRKVFGIGRVNERLLESIGIKVGVFLI
jgi:nucleotidyltransferase/DNA polymerase involved in DNA repair